MRGHDLFPSQDELNARAAAAVTPYGVGTRSYSRSTEKREMDRQREMATARYNASPHQEILLPPACTCRSFRFAHSPEAHQQLRSDYDWRTPEERAHIKMFNERIY